MTDEAKNQVYQILVEECPPGGSIPMTRVGEILREGGVTPQSLGYGKLKKMLEDMPDVVKLNSKTTESGLGQVWYATLLPRKGKKKAPCLPRPPYPPQLLLPPRPLRRLRPLCLPRPLPPWRPLRPLKSLPPLKPLSPLKPRRPSRPWRNCPPPWTGTKSSSRWRPRSM